MAKGYFTLVLHAHLPYVRHPEYDSFLEETWLFEANIDTNIPLLRVLDGLDHYGAPVRVTVSLSPPLISMLRDPFLRQRFLAHLAKMSRLGDQEIIRNHGDTHLAEVARMYRRLLHETEDWYVGRFQGDLIGAFADLQEKGVVELITAAGTHGYLPILKTQPAAVRAQLTVAADLYRETFGRTVPGFWLPECGYFPGVEDVVADVGGRFFFVDTHGVLNGDPAPRYGVMAPVACANGVAAFGRDPASSRQVWSANEGYPGDPWYRDFYRDIGFDLDFDVIKPYILDGHTRIFTGFKYYRITGTAGDKQPYEPAKAIERADAHATDFLRRQIEAVERAAPHMDRPPQIVALYDAELFGHWWFEGPQFLDLFLRKLAFDQTTVELITPGDYMRRHPIDRSTPSASSWGDQGYSRFWLNPGNDWIYRHLHDAANRMHALAGRHAGESNGSLSARALNQASRALLLAQCSDWPFIMRTGTAVEYAHGRIRDHLARFHTLADGVETGTVDVDTLTALEIMDPIFPDIDFRVYV